MTTLSKRLAVLASVTGLFTVYSVAHIARLSANSRPERPSIEQRYREVIVPAGTRMRVKLATSYSSASNHVEDKVEATLASSVRASDTTALSAGSRIGGVVSSVERPGKVKGRGRIGLRLTEIAMDGETYPMYATYVRVAPATKAQDAEKIGIPAAGGAIVGGLIGGKKGALTGAALGGGAGTAVVLSTRGKEAAIRGGSVITVTLRQAIRVRVPIR